VAALLSVSLSTATAHHGVLLFAMLLVSLLLYVEGRRYRFYDVYRWRVRQFERHYFAQSFAAETADPGRAPWLDALALDLRHPRFRIDFATAVTRRLRRNYIWLFGILLLGWVLKISSPELTIGSPGHAVPLSLQTVLDNTALGFIPGWIVLPVIGFFHLLLWIVALRGRRRADDDEVHV
jgi:uncharacterized membrane protein